MGGGVGLPHDDEQFAVRVVRTGRPPLPAIDDVFVALASDFGFDVGRVRRGDTWLGHRVSRADFAVHQRSEPAILLLARAVALQHLHVSGVGRRAVEHLGSPDDPAHHFREGRVFQVRQPRAFELERFVDVLGAVPRRHEQVPQPFCACLDLEFLHDRGDGPLRKVRALLVVRLDVGPDVSGHEGRQLRHQLLGTFGVFEAHRSAPPERRHRRRRRRLQRVGPDYLFRPTSRSYIRRRAPALVNSDPLDALPGIDSGGSGS